MKLYEITNEIQQIDDADDIDKLNQLLAEFENKSNDLLRYCLNIEADINAIAEHVKALLDRKKSLEKKKEAIIEYVFNNMKMNDINEIKDKDALFVIGTDVKDNVVYVGEGDSHPGLHRKALRILPEEIHWVDPADVMHVGERRRYMVRIRYRQPLQSAELIMDEDGLYILFNEPQRGITAGQFAAWYDGEVVAGSGVIEK